MKAMITNEKLRADYILMHLIKSEVQETTLVRNGVGTFDKTISEYGIFEYICMILSITKLSSIQIMDI